MRRTALALTALALAGCGSLHNLIANCPGDAYGGAARDMEWIGSGKPLVVIPGLIDLPFSFIVDTLTFPISWLLS